MNASPTPHPIALLLKWKWPLLIAGLVGVTALLYFFHPEKYPFYPQCLLFKTTGLQCPGCGGLRAMHSLLHGDVTTALAYNPLFLLTGALLALAALADWGCRRAGHPGKFLPLFQKSGVIWSLLSLAVLFGLIRNLPWFHS